MSLIQFWKINCHRIKEHRMHEGSGKLDVKNDNVCSHATSIVSEGFHVCTTCGVCLEDQVYSGIDINPRKDFTYGDKEEETDAGAEQTTRAGKNEDLQTLLNLCSNANLPTRYAHSSFEVFSKIKQDLVGASSSDKKSKKPRSFRPLLFATFYYILQKEDSSFTLREMTGLCEVPANIIGSAFNRYVRKSVQLLPSQLATRFCAKLAVPKNIQKEVLKTLAHYERLTDCALNPASVTAGVIYWFVKKNKLPLKLKIICSVCGVSAVSVSRFIRRFS